MRSTMYVWLSMEWIERLPWPWVSAEHFSHCTFLLCCLSSFAKAHKPILSQQRPFFGIRIQFVHFNRTQSISVSLFSPYLCRLSNNIALRLTYFDSCVCANTGFSISWLNPFHVVPLRLPSAFTSIFSHALAYSLTLSFRLAFLSIMIYWYVSCNRYCVCVSKLNKCPNMNWVEEKERRTNEPNKPKTWNGME